MQRGGVPGLDGDGGCGRDTSPMGNLRDESVSKVQRCEEVEAWVVGGDRCDDRL